MATTKFGKGTVFAFTDPWIYNEYTDGRKLPPDYDNFAAGQELVRWLLQQLPAPQAGTSSRAPRLLPRASRARRTKHSGGDF